MSHPSCRDSLRKPFQSVDGSRMTTWLLVSHWSFGKRLHLVWVAEDLRCGKLTDEGGFELEKWKAGRRGHSCLCHLVCCQHWFWTLFWMMTFSYQPVDCLCTLTQWHHMVGICLVCSCVSLCRLIPGHSDHLGRLLPEKKYQRHLQSVGSSSTKFKCRNLYHASQKKI